MSTPKFCMADTKRPSGCYVTFRRVLVPDLDADPRDKLFNDPDPAAQAADRRRLDAYQHDDWSFVGVRACADITVVRNGTAFSFSVESAGLWGVEDDSDSRYLDQVFREEVEELKIWLADLRMDQAVVTVETD